MCGHFSLKNNSTDSPDNRDNPGLTLGTDVGSMSMARLVRQFSGGDVNPSSPSSPDHPQEHTAPGLDHEDSPTNPDNPDNVGGGGLLELKSSFEDVITSVQRAQLTSNNLRVATSANSPNNPNNPNSPSSSQYTVSWLQGLIQAFLK